MAKIHEETIVIKLSKLVRDDDRDSDQLVDDDMIKNIEEAVQNLVSGIIVVEAEKE